MPVDFDEAARAAAEQVNEDAAVEAVQPPLFPGTDEEIDPDGPTQTATPPQPDEMAQAEERWAEERKTYEKRLHDTQAWAHNNNAQLQQAQGFIQHQQQLEAQRKQFYQQVNQLQPPAGLEDGDELIDKPKEVLNRLLEENRNYVEGKMMAYMSQLANQVAAHNYIVPSLIEARAKSAFSEAKEELRKHGTGEDFDEVAGEIQQRLSGDPRLLGDSQTVAQAYLSIAYAKGKNFNQTKQQPPPGIGQGTARASAPGTVNIDRSDPFLQAAQKALGMEFKDEDIAEIQGRGR